MKTLSSAQRISLALIAVLSLLLASCDGNQEEAGVVARVNDRPILLARLELKYDFMHQQAALDRNPTVNRLRQDYGQVLGDLIVQELVIQALEERGLAVSDEEIEVTESEIRADYPEGAFEEVLVEEYIDLKFWRQELRARLSMEKFFHEILRPDVKLDYQEAEAYYREHISDFYLPPRVLFYLVRGPSRDVLENALALYRETGDALALAGKFEQVTVQELKVREDRLTVSWKDSLSVLQPGDASAVLTDNADFQALILIGVSPAKVLDPSQAYPVVERELLDRKLHQAFEQWLTGAMAGAKISVSPHLKLEELGETAVGEVGEQLETAEEPRDLPEAQNATAAEAP